jgi:pilus assembly protein CpaF
MMTMNTAAYILDKVRKGASIIFTGTMASGKTTAMNTFIDFVRHDKRGLVIQENDELFSNSHPLFMFQTIRASVDGTETYDLRYLATFGLLMDLDYFIVGETKGREAEQFVEAVYTNTICWESIHAVSARDALQRHAALATSDKFSYKEQLRKLAQGIDLVVYLDHFVIEQITEIKGWDDANETVIYEDVPIVIPKKAET